MNFWIYLDCLESFKIDVMVECCIEELNEVCNDVKVRSRYSIFRKENIV